MTNEEYLAIHSGEDIYCNGKKLVFLPGSFKPPHKGHWVMVTDNLDKADEIHIFISKNSAKAVYARPATKTKAQKFLRDLKNLHLDETTNQLVDDIKVSLASDAYEVAKKKIDELVSVSKDDRVKTIADDLYNSLMSNVRFDANGNSIDGEMAEEIFKIYENAYNVNNIVVTHVCEGSGPIGSAVGFANHRCKNCDIWLGSTTADELAERDDGWNLVMKQSKEPTNRFHRLPIAPKIQAARDIRKNINNLTKDMFPSKISMEDFYKIKKILNPSIMQESKKIGARFNMLFESFMKNIVSESGIAIKNIQPIKRENIDSTLDDFWEKVIKPLHVSKDVFHKVGSTGKKDVSGDLDLTMNLPKALEESGAKDINEFANKVEEQCKKQGWDFTNALDSKFKTIHIGVPIIGQDGVAQLDIMPSMNVEYTKFRINAPAQNESKYKGACRSELLRALFKVCSMAADKDASDEDKVEYTDAKGKKWPGVQFSHLSMDPEGVTKVVKTFRGKKGMLSAPKTLSKTTVMPTDVQGMMDELFHGLYKLSDFNSFESIWNNVIFSDNFPYKDRINTIVHDFVARFNAFNEWQLEDHKVPMPEEVTEYLKNN